VLLHVSPRLQRDCKSFLAALLETLENSICVRFVRVRVLLGLSCRITSLATDLACSFMLKNVHIFSMIMHFCETIADERATWSWTRNLANLVLQHVLL